jgi:hypothetical protein
LVRALEPPQRIVVTTNMDELVVLDLEKSGLGQPLATVPPGARVYLAPEGTAAVAAVAAAEGDLIDLNTGERETRAFTVPDAGVVLGVSPGRSIDLYFAFTIDGAIGKFENGVLVDTLYLSDDARFSLRSAEGHRTPDGGSVAVHLSDPARPIEANEVFLVDLETFEVIFSVVGECPCFPLPTPDGDALILDTGAAVTVHTADGGARALAASSIDMSGGIVHAVDPNGDRILRGLRDGTVEVIDMNGGRSREVAEFGVEVSNVAFIDATRAVAVLRSGDVWLIDIERAERIGLVWKGGAGDSNSGAPTVSEDGAVLWVPTSSEIVEVPLSPDTWRGLACELAGRDLTAAEWDALVPGDGQQHSLCPSRS